MSGNVFSKLAKTHKALGNERRLAIISYLKHVKGGSATVGGVAEHIKLSFKATSKHLILLEQAGVLIKSKESLYVRYKITVPISRFVRATHDQF